MKHKLNITNEEIDSIKEAISQVISKGLTEPALVRLDYKLERLRKSSSRSKKDSESTKKNDEGSVKDNSKEEEDYLKELGI